MNNLFCCELMMLFLLLENHHSKIIDKYKDVNMSDNMLVRDGRIFGFWGWGIGVVRFANNVCTSASNLNGTCYTRRQCTDINGIASGTCASNIGVCCVLQLTCGQSSSYNNTYFVNSNFPNAVTGDTSCIYTIIPCSTDICQVRIDFISATLAQPDGDGNCVTDSIVIVGGGSQVPVLCGENSGQHIYVDFYYNRTIQIIITTSAAGTLGRSWNFRVTQIACDCPTIAPAGCLMFYTSERGTVQSFNYGTTASSITNSIGATGTRQLVNQNYGICVKMLPGYCSLIWSAASTTSFTVSHDTEASQSIIGTAAAALNGTNCVNDFVVVPVPFVGTVLQNTDRFCGNYFPTITTFSKPFVLTVYTNTNETGDVANRGFLLMYQQRRCTTIN